MIKKLLFAFFVGVALILQPLTGGGASPNFAARGYAVTDRGRDHVAWSKVALHTNAQGVISVRTNTIVHLSPGRNSLRNGQWVDSAPELVITNDAVLGVGAPCTARFPGNINGNPVVLTTSAGTLQVRVLGLTYQDPVSGSNVWLGLVKDSPAQVIGNLQVCYADAFSGITADVIFEYKAGGVTQDIAIRAKPAGPERWGLPENSHLIVVSEILDGPTPRLDTRTWAAGRETMHDQTADFGDFRMIPGRAFQAGNAKSRRDIAVAKQFETVGNRRLILERIRYTEAKADLMQLPPEGSPPTNAPAATVTNASLNKVTRGLALANLPLPPGALSPKLKPTYLTAFADRRPAFVVDWTYQVGLSDTYFQTYSGEESYTYIIEGEVRLSSATFEAGAVLKYVNEASLYIDGTLSCPVEGAIVLTSVYDDDWGDPTIATYAPAQTPSFGPALVVQPEDLAEAQSHFGAYYGDPGVIDTTQRSSIIVTASDAVATKGTSDTATITVSRDGGDWSQPLTVYLDISGTAAGGFDYQAIPNYVTIAVNQASTNLLITPSASYHSHPLSTVVVSLRKDPFYVLSSPSTAFVYLDDPSAPTPAPLPTPPGLIAWWCGENNALDAVGTNHGTLLNGLGFTNGMVNTAFNFDGVNDRLNVTNSAALNVGASSNLTIEAWIKPQVSSTTYDILSVVDKRYAPNTSQCQGYEFCLVSGRPLFHFSDSMSNNGSAYGAVGPDLRDGRFHHIAVTVDRASSTGGRIWIDGEVLLVFDAAGEPGSLTNSEPLHIGNHATSSLNCYFKGQIDEVSLYSRALATNEIVSIFNANRSGKVLDLDGNGLPDAWELQNYGYTGVDPNSDPDHDGKTVRDDYNARLEGASSSLKLWIYTLSQ